MDCCADCRSAWARGQKRMIFLQFLRFAASPHGSLRITIFRWICNQLQRRMAGSQKYKSAVTLSFPK